MSSPEEKLPQDVCGICLQKPEDGRLLACLHVFCCWCLEQLSVTEVDENKRLKCPCCRSASSFPAGGASCLPKDLPCEVIASAQTVCVECTNEARSDVLPVAFECEKCNVALCNEHVHVHLQSPGPHAAVTVEAKKDRGKGDVVVEDRQTYDTCAVHGKPLEFFCETCDEAVCGACTAMGEHRTHQPTLPVPDVAQRKKDVAMSYVERLRQAHSRAVRAMKALDEATRRVSDRSCSLRDVILKATSNTVAMVQACGQQLVQQVDDDEDEHLKTLDVQRDEMRTYKKSLENAIHFAERLETNDKTNPSLATVDALGRRAADLCQNERFICEDQVDREASLMELPSENEAFTKSMEALGKLSLPNKASAQQCILVSPAGDTVKPGAPRVYCASVGRESRWRLVCKDDNGQDMSSSEDVISIQCEYAVNQDHSSKSPTPQLPAAHINNNGDGTYSVVVTPEESGRFLMKVYVNGELLALAIELESIITSVIFGEKKYLSDTVFCDGMHMVPVTRKTMCCFAQAPLQSGKHTWVCSFGDKSPVRAQTAIAGVYVFLSSDKDLIFEWLQSDPEESAQEVVYKIRKGRRTTLSHSALTSWKSTDMIRFDLDIKASTLTIMNMRTGKADINDLPRRSGVYFPYLILKTPNPGSRIHVH